MNNSKILTLLFSVVVLINYTNYFMQDRDKLHKMKELLNAKINKELALAKQKIQKKAFVPVEKQFFFNGSKLNYSQSMGAFQKMLEESAKGTCQIKSLKWGQVAQKREKYDKLKIALLMECDTDNFFVFINKLRKKEKFFYIDNLRISKRNNKNLLQIRMQIIAYRKYNEQ